MKKYVLVVVYLFLMLCALSVPFLSIQKMKMTSQSLLSAKEPPSPPDDTMETERSLDETITIEEVNIEKSVSNSINLSGSLTVNGMLVYATFPLLTEEPPYIGILKTFVDKNRIIRSKNRLYQLKGGILANRNVSELQISADGQKILVIMGDAGISHATFTMYIWDISTNQVQKLNVPQRVGYPIIKWSRNMRYIAYIVGTDVGGNLEPFFANTIDLYYYDILEDKEKKISSNDSLPGNFEWSGENLYYSASRKINKDSYKRSYNIYNETVDIHAFSTLTNSDTMILADAYRPSISPNGKKIAFFSNPNGDSPYPTTDGWQMNPRGASLSVAHIGGMDRKRLNAEYMNYPFISWIDNENLLLSKMSSISPDQTLEIRIWSEINKKFKAVATLSGKDYVAANFVDPYSSFTVLGKNANNVMILSLGLTGQDDSNRYFAISKTERKLININLHTGKRQQIAMTNKIGIITWRYD